MYSRTIRTRLLVLVSWCSSEDMLCCDTHSVLVSFYQVLSQPLTMSSRPFSTDRPHSSLPVRTKPGGASMHQRLDSPARPRQSWLLITSNAQATCYAAQASTTTDEVQRLVFWVSGCSRAGRGKDSRKTCSAAVGFTHPQTQRWQHSIVLHRSQDDNLSSLNAELAAIKEALRQAQTMSEGGVDEFYIFLACKSALRHLVSGYGYPWSASCTRIVEEIRGRVQVCLARHIAFKICWLPKQAKIVPQVRVHKLAAAYLGYASQLWPISGCRQIRWEAVTFKHNGGLPFRPRLADALRDHFKKWNSAQECCIFIDSNLKAGGKKSARQKKRLLEKA